jgi:DNA (cytosine-5)-methyltransferase 1
MPDKQRFQAVVEGYTPSSFANYTEGIGTLRSNGGDLGGGSETLLAFYTQFGSNANVTEDVAPTLKASQQSPSVAYGAEPTMAVRRLTPLECERLMGWPDDHTRYKADGTEQADTHRYKQCGNGVASPVAEWIGKQLMKLDEAPQ